jgi:hypothetical protein
MGLRLGRGEGARDGEAIIVPVRLQPGLPKALEHAVLNEAEEVALVLSQWRATLEALRAGAADADSMAASLGRDPRLVQVAVEARSMLPEVRRWAEDLLKRIATAKPLGRILVEEDVLGVYAFGPLPPLVANLVPPPNTRVELYWAVVGLVAQALGVDVEDLTGVVLAHELAHAYSHVGADIDGLRWPNEAFSQAERGLVEGLAQYYTHQVCVRLREQYPGMLAAYQALLPYQPAPYQAHQAWTKSSRPEEIRFAMLESRRRRVTTLEEFNLLVKEVGERWHGGR